MSAILSNEREFVQKLAAEETNFQNPETIYKHLHFVS